MFWFLLKYAIMAICVTSFINEYLKQKTYIFSAESVANIAQRYKDPASVRVAFDAIHHDFVQAYGAHIITMNDNIWFPINWRRWKGRVFFLHVSFTEYVIFFGTTVDTVNSDKSRYWANISDTILTGSFRKFQEGKLTSQVYKSGVTVHHYWGEMAAMQWTANTWTVEYGRGFIPSFLVMATVDILSTTQDLKLLANVLSLYTSKSLEEFLSDK